MSEDATEVGAARSTFTAAGLRERPWMDVELPAEFDHIATMLSVEERQLLYFLSRDAYTGAGRIVDAGAFLGGSTAALAAGQRDRAEGSVKTVVASYDRFEVEPYALVTFAHDLEGLTIGDSFRAIYDGNVAALAHYVECREGDIEAIGWSGEAIEVLFLDVLKSWETTEAVLGQFLSHLLPERSLLVQQDYFEARHYWIHVTMELLWERFEFIAGMPNGSALFRTRSAPSADELTRCARDRIPDDLKLELMERAIGRWEGEGRGLLELARVWLIQDVVGTREAAAELEAVRQAYRNEPGVQASAARVEQNVEALTRAIERDEARAQLADTRAQLDDARMELEDTRARLEAARARLTDSGARILGLERRDAELRTRIAQLERWNHDMRTSASWRTTAPLRALKRAATERVQRLG